VKKGRQERARRGWGKMVRKDQRILFVEKAGGKKGESFGKKGRWQESRGGEGESGYRANKECLLGAVQNVGEVGGGGPKESLGRREKGLLRKKGT